VLKKIDVKGICEKLAFFEEEMLIECHFSFKFETSCTTILEKLKTYPKYILKRRSSRETRHLVRARENRTRLRRSEWEWRAVQIGFPFVKLRS